MSDEKKFNADDILVFADQRIETLEQEKNLLSQQILDLSNRLGERDLSILELREEIAAESKLHDVNDKIMDEASVKIMELVSEKQSMAQNIKDLQDSLRQEQSKVEEFRLQMDALDQTLAAKDRTIWRLEAELSDALEEPWPAWAATIYKILLEHDAVEGPGEEVDLGAAFEEWFNGFDHEMEEQWTRRDIYAQNFRLRLRENLAEIQGGFSKINQWIREGRSWNEGYRNTCNEILDLLRAHRSIIEEDETYRRKEAISLGYSR